MTCHYLEEDGYRKICHCKGISAPTFTELRLYCYRNPYSCPVYQRYIERIKTKEEKSQIERYENYLDERGNPEEKGLL